MKKFEYLTITIDTQRSPWQYDEENKDWSDFNNYGADGWELVTAVVSKYREDEYNGHTEKWQAQYYDIYHYTFKREIS